MIFLTAEELLPRVAPELTEWSAVFAASARRRPVVERGGQISVRESDDLLRQAEVFLDITSGLLGLPRPDTLTPISHYVAPAFRPRGRHERQDLQQERADGS